MIETANEGQPVSSSTQHVDRSVLRSLTRAHTMAGGQAGGQAGSGEQAPSELLRSTVCRQVGEQGTKQSVSRAPSLRQRSPQRRTIAAPNEPLNTPSSPARIPSPSSPTVAVRSLARRFQAPSHPVPLSRSSKVATNDRRPGRRRRRRRRRQQQ